MDNGRFSEDTFNTPSSFEARELKIPWTLSFWNEDTRGVRIHREDICLSIAAGIPEGTTDTGGSKGLQCGLVFDISFLVLGPR